MLNSKRVLLKFWQSVWHILVWALVVKAADTTQVTKSLPPLRLGHSLYLTSDDSLNLNSNLSFGSVYRLNPIDRERVNLRHSSDLTAFDVRFFEPDLVTDGADAVLSGLGGGLTSVKLLRDGRLLRNPRNNWPDFNRVSPFFVGQIRSVTSGALDGVSAVGGVVALDPLYFATSEPITEFAYREGYYDFAPMDFLHARPIAGRTCLSAGGYMPSSTSRYENAEHHGHNVLLGLEHRFQPTLTASLSFQKRYDEHGIAFKDNLRRYWDDNLYGKLKWRNGQNGLKLFGFRDERVEKENVFRGHYRESGGGLSASWGALGLYLRSSAVDLDLQQERRMRLTDVEGSLGATIPWDRLRLSAAVGGSGWYPNRVGLTGNAGLEADLPWLEVTLFSSLSRTVEPHSPETMYADYTAEARPTDVLDPVWNLRPDLPIQGAILPITRSLGGEFGLRKSFPIGIQPAQLTGNRLTKALKTFFLEGMDSGGKLTIESAYFNRRETTPWHWTVQGNTLLSPRTISDRTIDGWRVATTWWQRPFSAMLSFINLNRQQRLEHGLGVVYPEPTFRLRWMAGWRRLFDNGNVEADVSFSGCFINGYYTYRASGWQELGRAYPLDFKASMRIRRFTIYWGLHNWNSYQYYLMPDYKMMHKEEYFGIDWMLVD